jgi:protocatechuate 3,4-dioxygenase alpha subunit
MELIPTPWQTVGPYLHIGMTDTRSVSCMAGPGVKGERIRLALRLLDGDGKPVPDGMIETWQANADGRYRHPDDLNEGEDSFFGFGRMATDEQGWCRFETVKPGRVPAADGTLQAPHLNVGVFGRGLLKRLATRVYFAGEAANEDDSVLALVPADLRHTLLATRDETGAEDWRIEIHLCGDGETVFFDM